MKTQNSYENLIKRKGGTYFIKYSTLPAKLAKEAVRLLDNNDLNQAFKILDRVYWKLYEQNRLGSTWPFSTEYKRKVGSNLTHVWGSLVMAEILVCNGSYFTKSGKPKEYGINPLLLEGDMIQINYVEHLSTLKKIERYTLDVLSEMDLNVTDIQKLVNSKYPKIRKKVWDNTSINLNGSLTYWDGKKRRIIPKSSPVAPEEHFEDFVDQQAKEVSKAHQRALEALKTKSFEFPKRNNTNYRLNHVLTNLPKLYLSKCRIGGEELIEIDLKNSQFTLLSNLIKNPSLLYRWGDIFINRDIPQESFPLEPYLRLLHRFRDKEDIQIFQEYCYDGVLYEELCKDLIGRVTTSRREKVKSLMFALMFKELERMPKAELYDVFKNKFPNVIELITQLKSEFIIDFKKMGQKEFKRNINKSGNLPRYKGAMNFLAVLLQRLEAKIFIDEILEDRAHIQAAVKK